jgi:glycosyltransferase involved in cell wall biosynthesis
VEKIEINKHILLIIPCFNEAENIPALYQAIKEIPTSAYKIHPLFINDASTDNTKQILETMSLTFLDNPINLGIGGTVQLGFMYAYENGFDIAVQMDGDGQHPPRELDKLIRPLFDDLSDVVIGSRFVNVKGFQSTFFRRLGIQFFCWLNKRISGVTIKDTTSGYRAYNRKAIVELINYYPDEYPEPEAIIYLLHKKLRIKEIGVTMNQRGGGKSSIRYFNTLYYMAKVSCNIIFLHLKLKFHA